MEELIKSCLKVFLAVMGTVFAIAIVPSLAVLALSIAILLALVGCVFYLVVGVLYLLGVNVNAGNIVQGLRGKFVAAANRVKNWFKSFSI